MRLLRPECWRTLVDHGRKRMLLIVAAILASRNLIQLDSTRPSPAMMAAIHDAACNIPTQTTLIETVQCELNAKIGPRLIPVHGTA